MFRISKKKKVTNSELALIASCFWGNDIGSGQLSLWKKFDFSVIPIELLSEIYEIFLNKTKKEKADQGEYYTPHSLVDLILNESLPWADEKNTDYDKKILDVACGSGIFLVESYRRLVDRWIYNNQRHPNFKELETILKNSIFGFEINKEAIKVASFSLYLALISYLDPKTIWQKDEIKFPYLIYEPDNLDVEKQGKNLFRLSSLSNTIEHQPSFDLIVGNPPFKSAKTGSIDPEASEYCSKYGFAQEMVLPFLHRASQFCSETGRVAIISTSKILFNKSGGYQKFREFLFNKENYAETVINFSALRRAKKGQGKNIFADAVGPACVLFYRKNAPELQNPNITYVCPKPTERDQFSDDLVLDVLDFYYLPRSECQKPDSIIWKTAMWGTENDFNLISGFWKKNSLKKVLNKKKGWETGVGLIFMAPNSKNRYTDNELKEFQLIQAKSISRFTSRNVLLPYNKCLTEENFKYYRSHYNVNTPEEIKEINIFRAIGNKNTFTAPHLLVKEGQKDKRFTASFLNFDCSFKHTIYGISFRKTDIQEEDFKYKELLLKALAGYLNSKFASYALFLTSISWGVERERVTAKDLLELPALPFEMPQKQVSELAQKVDEISAQLAKDFKDEPRISVIENEIDAIVYKALGLTQREQYLVEDVLNYSLDLFQEGEKSPAYRPINQNNELKDYLEVLCEDINEHFQFSETTVWAGIWEMPVTSQMRLVAIHFTKEHPAGQIQTFSNSSKINNLIREIDKYSYEKYSTSIYFRKVLRYYSGDIIYIMKPNQKRFWSRSQAMQDSNSILLGIANMDQE
jgi:type I restriction-modification system DNA methylase subunit